MFEIRYTDLAGRIGRLETRHGIVETPSFVPVIHPVKQTIAPSKMRELGFDLLITNAYITKKKYGSSGGNIHQITGFDGAIMTDSGGYQVLEYGDLDVSPRDMALYEEQIGSDIAIPLDKPTGFGLKHDVAELYVNKTLEAAKETITTVDGQKTIWVGPIQGGEHLDLVRTSARSLDELGYNMFALGSPTEVMESYEFKLLAKMIIAAKKSIPSNKPLHLFGAGHPLTIPLAVALGCDTFDSASYMLYARDDRYMLPNGTVELSELNYLPCSCEVCVRYKASELTSLEEDRRVQQVALHNLHVIRSEVIAVKQAIMEGRLWEYVLQKSMSHPRLMEVGEVMKEDCAYLEAGTPVSKDKAIFLTTELDQYRPEVRRFHRMVLKTKSKKDLLLLLPEPDQHPLYTQYNELRKLLEGSVQLAYYSPFLGIVPDEISDLFPAAHHVNSRITFHPSNFKIFQEALIAYLKFNSFKHVLAVVDDFLEWHLNQLELVVLRLPFRATSKEIATAVKEVLTK